MRGTFAASPLGFARGTRAELDVGGEHVPGTRQFKKGRPRFGRYGAFGSLQGFQRKNPVVHGAFVQHVGARRSLRARLSAFQRGSRARVAFLTAVRCRCSPCRMTFVCPSAARFSSLSTARFRHSDFRRARRQAPATALRFSSHSRRVPGSDVARAWASASSALPRYFRTNSKKSPRDANAAQETICGRNSSICSCAS